MDDVMRKRSCRVRSRQFLGFFRALPLLVILPVAPLWAAEGSAQLTFQKEMSAHEKKHTYIVRRGDSIVHIVRKLGLPTPRRYRVIKQLNPHIRDLNRIYPGQKLLLPRLEEETVAADGQDTGIYTARAGDSLTRIIVSELHADPAEAVKFFGVIRQLNPGITNVNRIHPGQVIKLPRGGETTGERGRLAPDAPAESGKDEKALAVKPPATDKSIPLIRHVIEQLNGAVLTSGNHYIPLPGSGQIVVDCAIVPIVELEGTMVLLDFAGRLPDALPGIIRAHWKNYHVVKIAAGRSVASILQEILLASSAWQMSKVETPLSFDDLPQVKLSPDWLITRKVATGSASSQLGLIFAADKSQLLPHPAIAKYALKKGVTLSEILGDKVQPQSPAAAAVPPLLQIKGSNNDELLQNFLVYLGLESAPNREVKIFDSRKDGFDLALKAEYLMQMGGKTILVMKNKLPQQFSDRLKQEGMAAVYAAPGTAKIAILEAALAALDIPYQFAFFSVPPPPEKTRVTVTFPALKIAREKGFTYLIDFGMDQEIHEFLTGQWKLNMVRY
jgi:hypothetical protein